VGGVIAGYWNGNSAVITECVGPGTEATHHSTFFIPDHQFHIREIERIYAASNGRDVYLGDWHSHPAGPATLSALDKLTLQSIAKDKDAQCPRPVMLLFAEAGFAWSIHAFTLADPRWMRPRKVLPMGIRVF
jgi:integrative and conjugative element protein (TIGR02256 family)